jgi:hypothetical protein
MLPPRKDDETEDEEIKAKVGLLLVIDLLTALRGTVPRAE